MGEEGAGAVFRDGAHIVVFCFFAFEVGGKKLLDIDCVKGCSVGRAHAKDGPVAAPEQDGSGQQDLDSELEKLAHVTLALPKTLRGEPIFPYTMSLPPYTLAL